MTHSSRSRITTLTLMAMALALGALLFTALSPSSDTARFGASVETADAAAKTITINIKEYKYSKPSITVKKGTKIKWVNKDEMKHNATTSKAGGPKGPLLAKGKSYTWTASKKGTFNYTCSPHPFMKGKIIVK